MNDSKANHGFTADTLVLTRQGPRPIHTVKVDDLVLSRAMDSGKPAFKRVVRLIRAEQQAVYRLRAFQPGEGEGISEQLIVGANQRLYIPGHDTSDVFGSPEDDAQNPTGWLGAKGLIYGALLVLATGKMARVSTIDPIWLSKTEGVGRIDLNRWAEAGSYLDFRGGKCVETSSFHAADLLHTGNFLDRYNDADTAEEWAYRFDLHDLEVEDTHNYYVGDMGICVHDASPTSTE